jgi:adenosine deaminase
MRSDWAQLHFLDYRRSSGYLFMLKHRHIFVLIVVAGAVLPLKESAQVRRNAASQEETTSRVFEHLRASPPELRTFLAGMPKGADLHTHLGGAVYAESFIRAAADDGMCIDKTSFTILPRGTVCDDKLTPAANALKDQALYDSLIDAFSMRGFVSSSGTTGHDHFFATFSRFQNLDVPRYLGSWVEELANRAGDQNEQYLEIMHTPDFALAAQLGRAIGWSGNLAETREALLAKGLRQNVETDRHELDSAEAARSQLEACTTPERLPACRVTVRYLFQVLRGFPPEQVFAQALLGFELASVDARVAGINFVMPEDWYVPMTEYHRQMKMLDYLHSVYPKVHISLHAGELAPGLVPPDGLTFHIREAVELGHAERIGHGVDVAYEHDSPQLLREMAARHVMVEINLTSNDLILGIQGKRHPLPVYLRAHVPVAFSTDDEGVSRIDLTHEYERAAEEFGLGYRDLKDMARTSIKYCFLPDGAKAQQQSELEGRFRAFEAKVSGSAFR